MAYTKLDSGITESTIWQASDATRLVWITMLARADQNGYVGASVPGLAGLARVNLDACIAAIKHLEAPDEWSRTKDHEGRRIAPADGGWLLLNHAKYRAKQNADDRRERSRVAMAALRNKRKQAATVNQSYQSYSKLTQAEAEAEALSSPPPPSEKKSRGKPPTTLAAMPLPDWVPSGPWADFVAHRKAMRGVPFTDAARAGVLRELFALAEAGHDPAKLLETAVTRGWRTVFAPHAGSPNGRAAAVSTAERDAEARRLLFGSKGDVIDA